MSEPATLVPVLGLTSTEVLERVEAGQVNDVPDRTSRSYGDIVRSNVFTRFNAIISALAVVVLVVGHPIDALFALVMLLNMAIGIVQEWRAKRTLDRLKVLVAPTATAIRDGVEQTIAPSSLVLGDVLRLVSGDQVPVDAMIIEAAALEVDESALTGEADPVVKHAGDEMRSGSNVIAGTALVRASRVGREAWIHQLVAQAKEFALTTSEIRTGVDQVLRFVTWMIAPLGALLLWSQLRGTEDLADSLVAAVAGMVGLVPQGLVLLVSMAMAVAIIRLSRNHVVVQELHAVEGLARVDVLCVDKTGTLTTGRFELEQIIALDELGNPDVEVDDGDRGGSIEQLRLGLGALVAAEVSPTASTRVLAEALSAPLDWQSIGHVPFSSARKWSATTFEGRGTWIIGAPEILLDLAGSPVGSAARVMVDRFAAEAKRVLLVARSESPVEPFGGPVSGPVSSPESGAASSGAPTATSITVPADVRPVGLVVLVEQLRSDAAEIMDYFARQNVAVKIISGDSAATVSAVAQRLGIAGAQHHVDLRSAASGPLDGLVDGMTVFGRVLPEQKRELVEVFQRAGHVVAMTGDGVNDIPALKRADIGIAMDTATPATKSVAQLVLLDGRFDRLPHVVAEGRRVVANMERVSSLFVTKTVYAAIFVLVIGISGDAFPFLPRHLSLVSELTIGAPAFLLSFRAADQPCRPGYLRRVMRFAVPAGISASLVTLATYWVAQSEPVGATLAEARTTSTLALTCTAFWILYRLLRPLDRYDTTLLAGFIGLFALILTFDFARDFYALDWPPVRGIVSASAITIGSMIVLEVLLRWIRPQLRRRLG